MEKSEEVLEKFERGFRQKSRVLEVGNISPRHM